MGYKIEAKRRWPRRKSQLRKTADKAKERLQLLDRMMYSLFKAHPVIPTIEYAFRLIGDYAVVSDSERTYCEDVLRHLYTQAYARYAK